MEPDTILWQNVEYHGYMQFLVVLCLLVFQVYVFKFIILLCKIIFVTTFRFYFLRECTAYDAQYASDPDLYLYWATNDF
jgi:hypothetical protein